MEILSALVRAGDADFTLYLSTETSDFAMTKFVEAVGERGRLCSPGVFLKLEEIGSSNRGGCDE